MNYFIVLCCSCNDYNTAWLDHVTLFYREMVVIFEMSTERKTEPDEQSGYSMLHIMSCICLLSATI